MIQFILLGGVTAIATCIGVKKYLEDEENKEKIINDIEEGIEYLDELAVKSDKFFDDIEAKFLTKENEDDKKS